MTERYDDLEQFLDSTLKELVTDLKIAGDKNQEFQGYMSAKQKLISYITRRDHSVFNHAMDVARERDKKT